MIKPKWAEMHVAFNGLGASFDDYQHIIGRFAQIF
jgi:hypothetical protein